MSYYCIVHSICKVFNCGQSKFCPLSRLKFECVKYFCAIYDNVR